MKTLLICTLLLSGLAPASPLTRLTKKGWVSYYAGFQGSGLEVAVDTRGEIEFYLTPKRGQRLNRAWPVETNIIIERREKNGTTWVHKRIKPDGFTPQENVSFNQTKVELEATVTGDARFKTILNFDKNGVNISAEMIGSPKDSDQADYRLVLVSSMPPTLTSSNKYTEAELKNNTRGDEILLKFKGIKGQKIPLYKKTDTLKINDANPTSITLKADKIGRKKLTWLMLENKDNGALTLKSKSVNKRLLTGFNIRSILIDESGQNLSKGVRIQYK